MHAGIIQYLDGVLRMMPTDSFNRDYHMEVESWKAEDPATTFG